MSHRAPIKAGHASPASVVHTTLLSLVQTLTNEGHDEYSVCEQVVDLLEERRVVLTGVLRDQGIARQDLSRS